MTPDSAKSRETILKAGRATKYLVALSVVLMMALAGIFVHLTIRQNTLQDSIREDALWAVYQLDREARTLMQGVDGLRGLDSHDPKAVQAVVLRYDILYSRLSILDNAKYASFFDKNEQFQLSRKTVRSYVLELEPVIDAFGKGAVVDTEKLALLSHHLSALLQITGDLLTYTNTSVSEARSDAREEVMWLQRLSAMVVLALGVSIGLLVFSLMRQLRTLKWFSADLENTAKQMGDAFRAAEAGNRTKSEFMATMGHEIRTPLNAILGMAELLSHSRLGAEEKENVQVILSSGNALLEIINEILDFAKIEHGDLAAESVAFDAVKLVEQAVRVVDGRAREQGDRIDVTTEPLGSDGWYLGDPTRLRRVLLNLLSNAVKFTQNGIVRVNVSEINEGKGLRFEVADTGIGIPADARHRLFNAFSQVDGTISRRFGGTGLGLAICKRIIEGLGGRIDVDSTPGVGSKFWFEIPAERTAARNPQATIADLNDGELPRLRILVVEDNHVNRQVAKGFLDKLMQTVTMAVDGAEGVHLAASQPFDLILMDMQMPVMDGIAATKAIRATGLTVPIVAMTANASDHDRQLCIEAGMNAFEAKPITLKRLASLIVMHGMRDDSVVSVEPAEVAPPVGITQDRTRLQELVDAIGENGVRELTVSFLADVASLLTEIVAAVDAKDAVAADRALHSLKGAASNLGYTLISELAQACRSDPIDASVPIKIAKAMVGLEPATMPEAA